MRSSGSARGDDGFTLVELAVSAAVMALAIACVFIVAAPAREAFAVQPEAADVQQRVRVAVAMLAKEMRTAGAGRGAADACADPIGAPVLPYRVGAIASDAESGTFYRPDAISLAYVLPVSGGAPEVVRRTYYVKATPPDAFQLMQYDGRETDHPVLDNVVLLAFEYFGVPSGAPPEVPADAARLGAPELTDGPWCPDAGSATRFDADLLRIRRIQVRLRVQAPSAFRGPAGPLFLHPGHARSPAYVADQEIRFDVSPRNLSR